MQRLLLFICVLVGCALTNAHELPVSETAAERYLGDCNNDGAIDVTDITIMINFILNGNAATTSSEQYDFAVYNTNKDNTPDIDISDITALVNIILNETREVVEASTDELPIETGVGSGIALSPKK